MLTRIMLAFIHIDMICVADLIDSLGGNASVARDLQLTPSAVSEMKRRNSIPPKYWPLVIATADGRGIDGVTAHSLMLLHSPQHGGRAASCLEKSHGVFSQAAVR